MLIPFSTLPDSGKLWIYQSEKPLNKEQQDIISAMLTTFTKQWMVHGNALPASFEIVHNQFVVIGADEAASGCSIDTSVHVMKEVGRETGIDFFDRTLVVFRNNEVNHTIRLAELSQTFNVLWNENTLVFNNALSTIGDFRKRWLVAAGETWLKRYIPKVAAQN